jgi:hypothetical protein
VHDPNIGSVWSDNSFSTLIIIGHDEEAKGHSYYKGAWLKTKLSDRASVVRGFTIKNMEDIGFIRKDLSVELKIHYMLLYDIDMVLP